MNGPESVDEYIRVAAFRAALRRFMRASERVGRKAGLTPQRYALLLMVRGSADGSERASVTELADRLQLAQSSTTELVGRAEAVGLVERSPSPDDGRVVHVRLTDEGRRRLASAFTGLEDERRRLVSALVGMDRHPGNRL